MIIKNLSITYSGVRRTEIVKAGDVLIYRVDDEGHRQQIDVVPHASAWEQFINEVLPIAATWQKTYHNGFCPGVEWSIIIETDLGIIFSSGYNDFPDEFEAFVDSCRRITGQRDFASDHFRSRDRGHPPFVNHFNLKIKSLLKAKRKSVQQLADFLQYDQNTVRRQLNSMHTYDFKDLLRICAFLSQLPADFFYETKPDPFSSLIEEIRLNPSYLQIKSTEIQKQLVKFHSDSLCHN